MEIIDNTTQQNINPKEMEAGMVYKIILKDFNVTNEYIVMKVEDYYTCESGCTSLVDLHDGAYFQVEYDEFIQIEQVSAKLVIE